MEGPWILWECGQRKAGSDRQGLQIRRSIHPVLQLGVLRAGVDVDHGCLNERVAELLLDCQQMRPTVKQVRRQTVPQKMRVDAFCQASAFCGRANHLAQVLLHIGPAAPETDKKQIAELAAALTQVLGQKAHARRGDVRIAILLRLRGLDVQSLTAKIDVAYPHPAKLVVAQTGIGKRCNHCALAQAPRRRDQQRNLRLGERAAHKVLGFLGAAELDGPPDKGAIDFESDRRVDDVGVGGSGFMHPLDVLLDPLRSGLQADHGRQPADRGDVVVDGSLGQSPPCKELRERTRRGGRGPRVKLYASVARFSG
jgi:hypothetical protein